MSRFRLARSTSPETEALPAATMLRFVLGYDAVTDPTHASVGQSDYIARLCRNIDDASLKADWAEIEASGNLSVFQTYSWQRGLVVHLLAPGAEPLFITVRDVRNARLAAILPLQRRRSGGLDLIEYLGVDFCDTCQPLIAANSSLSATTASAFIDAVKRVLPPADLVRLAKMQGDLFGLANPFAALPGCCASADSTFPVELAADRDGFVGATSAYKAYQKQWRKVSRRDGVAFELFEGPEAIGAAFDAMIAMRNSRFTDLNRDDLLNDPKVAAFYREMALLSEPARAVRIAGLKVGDAYTAYIYMMDRAGKFSTVISAIDNSVGNAYAPGLILFTKIFERAVEMGYQHGDIGIGYMHYKTRFSCRPNPLFIWELPLTLKGRIALTGLGVARSTKQWAKDNKTLRTLAEKLLRRKAKDCAPAKVETPDEG